MIEQQIIGKYGQCHFGLNHLSSTMAEKYAFLIRYIFRSDFVCVSPLSALISWSF